MSTAAQGQLAVLPAGWTVRRVAEDKVVVQQETSDEVATYVADTRPGVPDEIFYRLASSLADEPVSNPAFDGLVQSVKDYLAALDGWENSNKAERRVETAEAGMRAALAKVAGA